MKKLNATSSLYPHCFRLLAAALVVALVCACSALATRAQIASLPPGTVVLRCSQVSESSGLARSRLRGDLFWTHNDSGDSPRLFAFDSRGLWHATLKLKHAAALDWEDMCSFTRDGKHYLAIADVGDNGRARKEVVIYGVREAAVTPIRDEGRAQPAELAANVNFEIHVHYPDGAADCEAMAYDPWREQFILVTKANLEARIYVVAFNPEVGKQKVNAEQIGSLFLPMVTGASIADDGQTLALATYGPTCLLRRPRNVDWHTANAQQRKTATWAPPSQDELELLPAPPRRQGESICFSEDGTHLFLTSEGQPMPLFTVGIATTEKPVDK